MRSKGVDYAGRHFAAVARALARTADMPADPVAVTVDVFRILAAVSVGLSRLRTMYLPRRRGRPSTLRQDPISAAEECGLDLTALAANLRRTPAERLRQLDAMADFPASRGPRPARLTPCHVRADHRGTVAAGARFVVVGGVAATIQGSARPTND